MFYRHLTPRLVILIKTEVEEIAPGTLVKIQYENSINRDSPIVTEIIEDRPEFTAVILASMVARSALNQFSTCSTDSSLSGVTHPTGDTLGESQQPEDELGESQQPEDGS